MRTSLIALVFAFAVGCGIGPDSPVVGGECDSDRNCEKLCSMSDTFGDGMCTNSCANDKECPDGAVCVDKDKGICAVSCTVASDCNGFGRAFSCRDIKRVSGGETKVCRLP